MSTSQWYRIVNDSFHHAVVHVISYKECTHCRNLKYLYLCLLQVSLAHWDAIVAAENTGSFIQWISGRPDLSVRSDSDAGAPIVETWDAVSFDSNGHGITHFRL